MEITKSSQFILQPDVTLRFRRLVVHPSSNSSEEEQPNEIKRAYISKKGSRRMCHTSCENSNAEDENFEFPLPSLKVPPIRKLWRFCKIWFWRPGAKADADHVHGGRVDKVMIFKDESTKMYKVLVALWSWECPCSLSKLNFAKGAHPQADKAG